MSPKKKAGVNVQDPKAPALASRPRGKVESYSLCLYIAGATPRSMRAVVNLKKICADHLAGNYTLEVVDIYQQPQLAERDQIIAVPTLVKKLPLPVRRLVGDLSDTARVLATLDMEI